MTKKRIRITDGGIALPLGNNTFLMKGRLHSQGGIGIGNGGKNDIEVEDGEVVKFNKDNIQVLSDQPMLNGISPANALLAGGNFNKIFKAQQSINGNYGGSYAEDGTNKDDIAYNKFIETLPDNQRYTDTTKYDMRRYWELNGKPKNFKESINREEPMFHLEDDGYYHASTIAWNDKGEGEFIKNRNHETIGLEIGSYLRDKNHLLRSKEYILDATGNKIKYRKRTPSETILPEGAYIGDLKENQKYSIGGIIKKIIDSFTDDKKENTNGENKKDNTIDWDEIKIKQAYTESGFDSKAVSKAPAYGLYQITPQTLKEFNDKTGNSYKVEDLYNDKINTEIRDWYMNDLYNREWNTKNNPSDSVRATKTIMAYNMGPTNLVNRLNELKAKGYDIYQSLDWTQDDSIPVESREYNDFILRNINNSTSRNQLAYETSRKKNADKVEGIKNGFKNGGKINMKLKHKNKQDITDIVMNEILPSSTGERKKFLPGGVWGASEWGLAGNLGLNALNALTQGTLGSIFGNKAIKTFNDAKSKLKKIFTPVAREYIDTRVAMENELSGIKQSTAKLIENAKANTSNAKVARSEAQNAIKQQNELEHRAYTNKYREESNRREMAAKLATQYNIIDNQNYIQSEKEYQDKLLQLDLGIANAEMSKGQTWGNAIGSALKAGADTITDYTTMTNDLLKSNNPYAYAEYMRRNYGRFLNSDGTLKDIYKGNTRIENFYNKNLKPLFFSSNVAPQIITYDGGLLA